MMRRPKRYRLTFINENTFNAVWSLRLSRTRAWLLGGLSLAAFIALIVALLWLTPLGNYLPGYMKPEQRRNSVESALRVDSLLVRSQQNNAWLTNVRAILEGTTDTVETAIEPLSGSDTLLTASEAERNFVEAWTDRERFNLSVITPVVSSSMAFIPPVNAAMAADSATTTLNMLAPRHAPVVAIYAGTVIDVHTDIPSGTQSVIIQHPNDFISRTDGLSDVMVTTGRKIPTGQAIGRTDATGRLSITIWHDGTPIDPRTLLPL